MQAIALGVGQEEGDAFTATGFCVLHREPSQLIPAEPTPESDKHHCHRAALAQERLVITAIKRGCGFCFQPFHGLFEVGEQEGGGLLDLGGMHNADALDHLAHVRRLGRVWESLGDVPLRQRGQTLLERADRMLVGVFSQVANDAVACSGQVTHRFTQGPLRRNLRLRFFHPCSQLCQLRQPFFPDGRFNAAHRWHP